jgi:hypothetical protein
LFDKKLQNSGTQKFFRILSYKERKDPRTLKMEVKSSIQYTERVLQPTDSGWRMKLKDVGACGAVVGPPTGNCMECTAIMFIEPAVVGKSPVKIQLQSS